MFQLLLLPDCLCMRSQSQVSAAEHTCSTRSQLVPLAHVSIVVAWDRNPSAWILLEILIRCASECAPKRKANNNDNKNSEKNDSGFNYVTTACSRLWMNVVFVGRQYQNVRFIQLEHTCEHIFGVECWACKVLYMWWDTRNNSSPKERKIKWKYDKGNSLSELLIANMCIVQQICGWMYLSYVPERLKSRIHENKANWMICVWYYM